MNRFHFGSFQLFKSLRVQLEMRRKQVEGALQSTQKDGMLTVDQALAKQAWERVSNRVREAGVTIYVHYSVTLCRVILATFSKIWLCFEC